MNKNIAYKTKRIPEYYGSNRCVWEEFYESERWVIDRIAGPKMQLGKILDVGCAAGGLGLALSGRFRVESYYGVDISSGAIAIAKNRKYKISSGFSNADILKMPKIKGEPFDVVFSFSCADWNIETRKIINNCWKRVKPGGYFIMSVRLTNKSGINDINKSYQYICFEGKGDETCEKANYVVFNISELLSLFSSLDPSEIIGYGYWGQPRGGARTPFKKLAFGVFAVRKRKLNDKDECKAEMNFPISLFLKGKKAQK